MTKRSRGRPAGGEEANAAFHRTRCVLEALTAANGATLDDVRQSLRLAGLDVGDRQVRNILDKLVSDPRLNVQVLKSERPYRWRLHEASDRARPANMTMEDALKISVLGEESVCRILPRFVRRALEQEIERARTFLELRHKVELRAQWARRVRLRRPQFRHSVERVEPRIDENVERQVHEALLDRLPLIITYASGHLGDTLENIMVYPIGIDCQLHWVTLVGQLAGKDRSRWGRISHKYGDDYVQLPLHRIRKAQTVENGSLPRGFDEKYTMDRYIDSYEPDRPRGGAGATEGREIELIARVTRGHAADLADSPLRSSRGEQQLERLGEDNFRLRVHLIETETLLRWCAALCDCMTVEEPEDFKMRVDRFLEGRRLPYDYE